MNPPRYRILALIPPREEHVGHWACSSAWIEVSRLLIDADTPDARLIAALDEVAPDAVAILGKRPAAAHDRLDRLGVKLPRIFRCQNTVLAHRLGAAAADAAPHDLAKLSGWFAAAADPRFDLVLVQTTTDTELIRRALPGRQVFPCPYGYDPAMFNPDAPDGERPVDVGCYLSLKGDPRRIRLVEAVRRACARNGWRFRFADGQYGIAYAREILETKVCLHMSERQEIPFRIYECTALGSVLATDPLACGIENFFRAGEEYLEYPEHLDDLEDVLRSVLEFPDRLRSIASAGRRRSREYTWPSIAERYVVPALRSLLGR